MLRVEGMIEVLADHIVHQIAAGEVIERPASALKELVENAIDAGASSIFISYRQGGLNTLIVEDNGAGISLDEIPLAFRAHATSKLKRLEDFDALRTYGFRGEALCSLASVSDLEIWSSRSEDSRGVKARSTFGRESAPEAADRRLGTQILVKSLFERHPARLKFMKSERSETLALSQVFRRYALAHPEISWTFKDLSSGKEVRLPKQSFVDRVLWFFDTVEKKEWFEVQSESSDWKISAYALQPRYIGQRKSGIHLFLNRRPLKDTKLEFAVRRGFEGFTEQTREIACALYLEGSAKLFDVNVHPMKHEVRFIHPEAIFSQIVSTFRPKLERLHQEVWGLNEIEPPQSISSREFAKPFTLRASDSAAASFYEVAQQNLGLQQKLALGSESYEFLTSLDDTYLFVKKGGDLFVFDQHALHERIIYERLLTAYKTEQNIDSQRLLFPVPLVLENAEVLLEQEEILSKLGFELRLWSDNKIQIVSAPSILKRDYKEVLRKLLESLQLPVETCVSEVLSTLACHSAVRAHDRLQPEEIIRLLKDFSEMDAVGHCPHGRPTFVPFKIKDLEKLFHRVL